MSPEATPIESAVLVTIIGETVLKDSIVQLLKSHNVSGYTIIQAQGEGGHGRRLGDMASYNTNVEIKTIVSSEVSDTNGTKISTNEVFSGVFCTLKKWRAKSEVIARLEL